MRKPRRLRQIVSVLALAWLGVGLGLLAAGSFDMWSGQRAINAARRIGLTHLSSAEFARDVDRAESRFGAARDRFSSPVLAPVLLVPGLERQLRAARDLASGSHALMRVGNDASTQARALLASNPPHGRARVALIRRVSQLAARTDARVAAVDLGPNRGPVGVLQHAHAHLQQSVTKLRVALRKANAVSAALADVMDGPRSYLVFAANNAEMRAGSGMFLSVGRMDASAGQLALADVTSVNDVAVPPGVPLTGDLADRWGWLAPQTDWRNLMLSPQFPVAAQLATTMWEAGGRAPVDGVIVVDPVTVRALLAATGPVTAGGREISARNVVKELTHDQYARYRGANAFALNARRENLGAIAAAAFAALETTQWSPERLASGLANAAKGRHLLLWSKAPGEQRGWRAARVDGRMAPDSLLASVLNRGGNKLDYWMRVSANLQLRPLGDHTEGVLRLRLTNPTPAHEPPYISGPAPGLPLAPSEYLGLASITLPGDARSSRFDGVDHLAVAGADGPNRVVATEFRLLAGKTRTLVVRFRLPGRHGAIRIEPSARVPGVDWTFRGEHWTDSAPRVVIW